MRSESRLSTFVAALASASTAAACGGSTRVVRDESVPVEQRLPSEDRTVAKVGVRDGAVIVVVERQLACRKGSYEDRIVEEPAHGSGWMWGGASAIGGGIAVANSKDGGTAGAVLLVGGAALVVVGAAKLAAGSKRVETKGEATWGPSQTCATAPVVGAFVSVTAGPDSLAVQSTDASGAATMPIDDASWERAPLSVHVDLTHEKTVVVEVMRDGSTQPARTEF